MLISENIIEQFHAVLWRCTDILRIWNTAHAGLGMYGDSEDSDSGDEAAGNSSSQANGADSDEELRVRGMTSCN